MDPQHQPEQLSNRKLDFGYWVATHRKQLKTALTVVIGAIAAASVLVFLFYLIMWLTHIAETNRINEELNSSVINFNATEQPRSIETLMTTSVRRDDERVDVVVHVRNPNATWSASAMEYELLIGGQSAGMKTITLASMQEKYLVQTNIPYTGTSLPPVSLSIQQVEWKRTADQEALPTDDWEFINPSFRYIGEGSETSLFKSELSFTIQNRSVFGFREPEVVVQMKDASGTVQAVDAIILDQIDSLETRDLTFKWPERLPRTLDPVIWINVDKITEERIIR